MSGNLLTNKEERFSVHQGQREISQRAYNLIIGGTLLYGFAVNAFMIRTFEGAFDGVNSWALIIGYIVCVIIGAVMTRSSSGFVSFIGYNFIVVPLGVMLTILLPYYGTELVFQAVAITGTITLIMMAAGAVFPNLFLKMGRTLFFTLIAVVLVELFCVVALRRDFAIMDYIVVVLFSGYIGYDWAKANVYQKTVNNAIDSAVDLYMDIINIFIRVLSILSRD